MKGFRLWIWILLMCLTLAPLILTKINGTLNKNGWRKLNFPLSEHLEAIADIPLIALFANYLLLAYLPAQSIAVHASCFVAGLAASWYAHQALFWPRNKASFNHMFPDWSGSKGNIKYWRRDFSLSGWLHFFFFAALAAMLLEYVFLAKNMPDAVILGIGGLFLLHSLIAAVAYYHGDNNVILAMGYKKTLELAARFIAVFAVTTIKLFYY